jgi:hypothetical protein
MPLVDTVPQETSTQVVNLNGRETGHLDDEIDITPLPFHALGNFDVTPVHADCNSPITGFRQIRCLIIQEPLVRLVYRTHPLVPIELPVLPVSLLDCRLVL